jgi:hypothetical protein
MAQEQDLPEEVTRSVATEINFLRLPIFTTSKSDGERQTDRYDYGIHNDRFQIEITHERNLTAYDRKMLLAIEYLYLRQNPSFESNMVVTTFKEVADVLGMSASNTQKIYESLSKLRSVEIKTMLKVRRDQRDYDVKSEFNLLYRITRVQSESSTGGPTRTNRVEIVLNDWHVENFRNRYYRVVNMGLVAQLRSGIAVRLFDYLNYTVFYYDSKAGRYRQKMNTEIPYIALVEYLHISPQRGIKNIRKQFATALKELREKGVIQDWQFERRSNDVYLKLTLARSINWREVTSENLDRMVKLPAETSKGKKSVIGQRLKKHGLSTAQVKEVEAAHGEPFLAGKVDQLEYLLEHHPEKVKGASRYLYKAITDDWTDDDFDAHRDKESEKQLREEQRRQKELEQAYDAYRTELRSNYLEQMTDLEREDFDAEVERRAQEQVTEERKWMLGALRLMEKERMLDEAVDLPSFVDWCEAREYEQAQLDLF